MSESEWLICQWPLEMLRHLDGKIEDEAFIHFSTACCRRLWPLISDTRSRAVVEATEATLRGSATWEVVDRAYHEWQQAHHDGLVCDLAGGATNEAIESVGGLGEGHAAHVAIACYEAIGYQVWEGLQLAGADESDINAAVKAAQANERLAQCELLRELFGHRVEEMCESREPSQKR